MSRGDDVPGDDGRARWLRRAPGLALAAMLAALGVLVALSAWVSDDAYITLRTLDNFLGGYGLRYNPSARVQAFTHPLWLAWLAIPYAITGEPWLTTMAVGFVTSLSAAGLLAFGVARSRLAGGLALMALASSKAFVDYATSGLEGPLLWLLLGLFGRELFRGDGEAEEGPRLVVLVSIASFVALTRLDAILFVLPGLALSALPLLRRRDWGTILAAQLAWGPLLLWHAFSLVYYGSLVPNTALAKLGASIPPGELLAQAPRYFEFSWTYDPATLVVIALGALLGPVHRDPRGIALGIGIVAYLVFIVRIGGDFMGGRFFVAPLFVSAMLVARYLVTPTRGRASASAVAVTALAAGLLGLSISSPYSPLRAGPGYKRAKHVHGVVDERGFYWGGTGLWISRDKLAPGHLFARQGRKRRGDGPGVVNKAVIGMYGYYAGPEVTIVDRMALADPVLARLPVDEQRGWRIGHFERRLPDGYLAHLAGRDVAVQPPAVAELVRIVDAVTKSESLFTWERWQAIWQLHDGTVERLVDEAFVHYPKVRWVDVNEREMAVDAEGVGLKVGDPYQGRVRLDLTPGLRWRIVARRGRQVMVDRTLWGDVVTVRLPPVDKLVIFALGHDGVAGWTFDPEISAAAPPAD